MGTIITITIILFVVIVGLTIVVTNKAYSHKHNDIDPELKEKQ
ncbi:YtzI protein [Brevibacillus fulvus]|uniref:Membrane protein n=1 Tax=Brevibacillus fulvus TaxID=1125967 RepID=A0A938Y2U6_9BACL|nr:YtzI protein [Brevibacillus fulvus]MBM7592123.1 putative membrane protein [Brevibacillus fulvus]